MTGSLLVARVLLQNLWQENINYYLVGNPKEVEYYQKIENAVLENIFEWISD